MPKCKNMFILFGACCLCIFSESVIGFVQRYCFSQTQSSSCCWQYSQKNGKHGSEISQKKGKTFPIHYFLQYQSQFKILKLFKEDNLGQGIPEHLLLNKCVLKQTATAEPPPMHSMCSEKLIARLISKLGCSDAVAAVWWGLQDHNFAPICISQVPPGCILGGKSSFKLLQCQMQLMETLQESPLAQSSSQTDRDFKLFDMLFLKDKMGKK